jgi:hypothetical protein
MRLERVLHNFGTVPRGWRTADWGSVQPDPYVIRRWREQLAGMPATSLHKFALTLVSQVAAASRPGCRATVQVCREVIAQAVALDQEMNDSGRLCLGRIGLLPEQPRCGQSRQPCR